MNWTFKVLLVQESNKDNSQIDDYSFGNFETLKLTKAPNTKNTVNALPIVVSQAISP